MMLLAGCGEDSQPAPQPLPPDVQAPVRPAPPIPQPEHDSYATTGSRAAEGLTPAERSQWGSWLAGSPNKQGVVRWTERSDTPAAQYWRAMTHQERVDSLRALAKRGDARAARTLNGVVTGGITEAELAEWGDLFAPLIRGTGRRDGVEPMPFGDSMFGPWDTGPGSPKG
jgi:hypothetical protein